ALIPVVDEGDRVLGVVTYDDVLAALIPQDWRRREPAPRPVRQAASNPDGVAP
ncbi:magnesium transporter MgtE, partial [Staphylococcus capitis]|nr:magnesium transporter MgtE [Staphylococcus capitis]